MTSAAMNFFRTVRTLFMVALALMPLLVAPDSFAQATTPGVSGGNPVVGTGATKCNSNIKVQANAKCNVCLNDQFSNTNFPQFNTPDAGKNMINQIFIIVDSMLKKIQESFYTGIVNNVGFQQIIGILFILYLTIYGVMIMFNLASYRSGEVTKRMIKLAIVYGMCTPGGWVFFSQWIQMPVIGTINQLITNMASATSGSGGACVTGGTFSGNPIITSGTAANNTLYVSLSIGPMAMLWNPMTCVFAAKFFAGINALISTGFYGWILALMLIWGLVEFAMMLLGAIVTYIKSIVGLTFLFGIAPIFFAFYLFEKTRSLTEGWMSMVIGFALQPVMLFAFLAFYASIIGTAVSTIFTDTSGNQNDICYVPFYTLPGMFSMYWWRFSNSSGAAGGNWLGPNGGSGSMGNILPPPAQILSVLYFIVLCNLGKNFTSYINDLSSMIAGGRGVGAVSGEQVGGWFRGAVGGGEEEGGGPGGGAFTRRGPAPKSSLINTGPSAGTRPPMNTN